MRKRKVDETPKTRRGFVFACFPNKEQAAAFQNNFDSARFVWNKMLYDSMESFKETGKTTIPSPASYKTDNPWLKDADSLALANVQLNLKEAYSRFFQQEAFRYSKKTMTRAKRQGRSLTFYELEKHPKFKRKKDFHRKYTTNNQSGTIAIVGDSIKLPKIGLVRCKFHRPIPIESIIKSATVKQHPDGTYTVSVLVESAKNILQVEPQTSIGLDMALNGLYVDSNNEKASKHRFYRESEYRLAVEQRKLSHMVKGSNNYRKQKLKIAEIHRHIANQRKDFLHKQSRQIANAYDVVCIEDLDISEMAQSLSLGKSVHDNGWSMFVKFLTYKLDDNGHYLQKVNRFFPSSKTCRHCKTKNKNLQLCDRKWACAACGVQIDRDHNAAINIHQEGLRLLKEQLSGLSVA